MPLLLYFCCRHTGLGLLLGTLSEELHKKELEAHDRLDHHITQQEIF